MYQLEYNKIPINYHVSNCEENGRTLFEEGFGELFRIEYDCLIYKRGDELQRVLRYSFILKYSINENPFMTIIVDENDNILDHKCLADRYSKTCKHFFALVRYYESLEIEQNIEELNKEFERIEEEIRIEEYKVKRKESMEKLKSFLGDIDKYDTLVQNKKMSIDCRINFEHRKYQEDSVNLSIRVGDEKKYVVQNVRDFVAAVRENSLVSYGKKFSFVHSLEAFDDFSREIVTFLAAFSFSEYNSKKEVDLAPIKAERLLELFKNRFIYVENFSDDCKYLVSDKMLSPKLYLDKDHVLNLKGVKGLIEGYSKDFVICGKEIFELENKDPAYRKLINTITEQKGISFAYIKDVFEKSIYPRFAEEIEIDESIKNGIKTEEYQISSYFDYKDGILLLDSKYKKGNKEISLEKLNKYPYKINRYLSYVANLGFKNNCIEEPNLVYNFLRTDLSELKKLSDIYLSENLTEVKTTKMKPVSAHMSYKTGMLDICFEESGFTDEELYRIITNLKKKMRFIKLNKDTIIEVDEKDANKLLNTIDTFKLDAKKLSESQSVPLYQSLKMADDIDIVDYTLDESLKNLIQEIVNFKELNVAVPESLKEIMRGYQVDAYKWMKTLIKHNFCGVLADDMGLGKTLEVISVIMSDKTNSPSLIVCPKSLCYNWKNEFSLWAKDIQVINVIGGVNERKQIIEGIKNKEKTIYVSSYDSLRNDIDLYKSKKFNFLVLDEAQSIKNHNTLKAKSVKKIKSSHRFVLTGTPIENSVVDLWSIFDFLMPEYLGDYSSFRSKYEEAVVSGNAEEVVDQLIRKISPFVLRRTKKEVLKDLPDKIETIQIASMESEQRLVYEAKLRETREILVNPNSSKIEILSCLTRLRQICVHPELFVENYKGSSAKFDLLMDLLEEYIANDHKVIIFSQFTSAFDLLTPKFNEKKYKYFILTGKTSAEDRIEMAKQFNMPEDAHKIFLVSLKAGGTGLNLVGADIVIHLDPWWNYAVENQATDRAHRIGQKNVVQVVKIICENSIEQKVIELQNIKKEVAERIIVSDEDNYNNINVTDIKYLLD